MDFIPVSIPDRVRAAELALRIRLCYSYHMPLLRNRFWRRFKVLTPRWLTRGEDRLLHNMRKYLAYERAASSRNARRIKHFAVQLGVSLGLCGAVLAYTQGARAQSLGEAIGRMMEGANLRNSPPPPPDFVTNSRPEPGAQDYTPFAAPDAAKAKKKTAKDFEAIGAELNKAGALNRQRGAQVARPEGGAPRNPSGGSARNVQTSAKRVD